MTVHWEDVVARSRGLGTHLFTRAQLESLTRVQDAVALADACRRVGLPLGTERETATAAELELAVRRWAGAALRVLARWAGPRVATLAVIYEDEDRKSLRAIVRGALQGAAAESRLAGLIPTPSLPERALNELARQPAPAAIATLLTAWQNPYGAPLASVAARHGQPDALDLDQVLDRTFATRALAAARPGGPELVAHVRESIDLTNAVTALVLAVAGKDVVPKDVFLPGGERVTIVAFEEAVATAEVGAAGQRLVRALSPAAVAGPFRLARDPAEIEPALLRIRIRELARHTRRSPLGPAPILWYALRLRAQVVDLQRIIWGAALAVPPGPLTAALVTAP